MTKTTSGFTFLRLFKNILAGLAFVCLAFAHPSFGQIQDPNQCPTTQINGFLGSGVTSNLLIFTNGSDGANWQGASKGYAGNVIVDGIQADERTSGFVPYAGIISTNAATLSAWQDIIDANPTQSSRSLNAVTLVNLMQTNVGNAILAVMALPVTPGYTNRSSTSLNGLNTQNGVAETFVIDVTSDFSISSQINITGDKGDLFILRWDTDQTTNGLQGQVKFQSGGAIVPLGGLTPANFIHIAGNIGSSGGGSTPAPPYPQGPRLNNGTGNLITGAQDFNGGGFFTGYWLTTGTPSVVDAATGLLVGPTASLSNGIFVGGWYSLTTQFSMTSGTSGVNVTCDPLRVTAAPAEIRGRVITSLGGGLNRAMITLTNLSTGEVRYALTNPFGYYGFVNVDTEQVYSLSADAKGYKFANNSRTITLLDNLAGADFVGTPVIQTGLPGRTLLKKGVVVSDQ